MTPERVGETTILRAIIGSTAHGLHVEGADDRDEMGVCVEDIEFVAGLWNFEQYIYRTAHDRTGDRHAKSEPGDLDLTIYGLRKYLRLALDGNPTILNLLFVPPAQCACRLARGAQLQELAPLIVSRKAAWRYLGYLTAQRQRLTGERGQKRVKRSGLEEEFGFDTKYAMHMLRLGYQGIELLETGRVSLPMCEPERNYLRGVRIGLVSLQDCLTRAGELETHLRDLGEGASPLPNRPNFSEVEQWAVSVYLENWKAREFDREGRESRA